MIKLKLRKIKGATLVLGDLSSLNSRTPSW